jgi:2-amino-4-hydroxy-6-hydroxymethyldihydropteridine diphosphokinase
MQHPAESLTSNNLPHRAWIGAGSRDGERLDVMTEALRLLRGRGLDIVRVSSVYETEPVDLTGPRTVLNGAFEVAGAPAPADLLAACLAVEKDLGRRREEGPEGARPIDLDILLYDDLILDLPGLTVPHPRMHRRLFVLSPLAEIAPLALHPRCGMTVSALLEACPRTSWVRLFAGPERWDR